MSNIQFLLKFGKLENLTRLVEEGMIYAKPIKDFKKDRQGDRYDLLEGLHNLHHLDSNTVFELKVKEEDNWKRLNITKGKFQGWLEDSKVHNYSMYSITEQETREQELFPIPKKMKENYGNHFILINKPGVFIEMLKKALDESGLDYKYSLVNYYDENENQNNLGYFHKSNIHSYEKEFRIVIFNESTKPTSLFLGSLKDIASIHNASQFPGFRFIWPDVEKQSLDANS